MIQRYSKVSPGCVTATACRAHSSRDEGYARLSCGGSGRDSEIHHSRYDDTWDALRCRTGRSYRQRKPGTVVERRLAIAWEGSRAGCGRRRSTNSGVL